MRTLKNILTLMLKEFRSVLTDPVLMVLIGYIFTATIYVSRRRLLHFVTPTFALDTF